MEEGAFGAFQKCFAVGSNSSLYVVPLIAGLRLQRLAQPPSDIPQMWVANSRPLPPPPPQPYPLLVLYQPPSHLLSQTPPLTQCSIILFTMISASTCMPSTDTSGSFIVCVSWNLYPPRNQHVAMLTPSNTHLLPFPLPYTHPLPVYLTHPHLHSPTNILRSPSLYLPLGKS